ncbi:ribonuclease H-like protein, partial [Exidia glandulosa HHB12029]
MLIDTLERRQDPVLAMHKLFGSASIVTHPVVTYTDGSCHNNGRPNASAGSGVYWGEENSLNSATRTPGPGQTNNRAELYAFAVALRDADSQKSLRIVSDSEYAITAATWNAPKAASRGYNVPNGDIVKWLVWLIQRHKATVRFSYTKGHHTSYGNKRADEYANKGA